MLAITLFIIFYSFLCVVFSSPDNSESVAVFPEQVFQIIDDESKNNREYNTYDPWLDDNLGVSKESLPKPKNQSVCITSMSFSALKKIASRLKKSGLLKIKITGKGVTKKFLSQKIEEVLKKNPEAYNLI